MPPEENHETSPEPPVPPEVPPPAVPPARRKKRRWLRRLGIAALLSGSLLVTLVAALVLFAETDRARRMVVGLAADEGLALDYRALELSPLRGRFVLEDLALESPPPFAAHAPHWLSVRRIDLAWSASALLTGELKVEHVRIEGVRLHVVIDAEGEDSISAALAALSSEEEEEEDEEESGPLSRLLRDLELPMGLSLRELAVTDVEAEVIELSTTGVARRTSLEGLELRGALPTSAGGLEANLRLGSPENASLRLQLEEQGETTRTLDARWVTTLRIESGNVEAGERVALALTLDVLEQSFEESLDLDGRAIDLALTVRFDPDNEATHVDLERLHVFDEGLRASLGGRILDSGLLPVLRPGEVRADLDALAARLPDSLGLSSEGGRVSLTLTPIDENRAARVALDVSADRLAAAGATLEGARVSLRGELGPTRLSLRLEAPIERVGLDLDGLEVGVEGVTLEVDAPSLEVSGGLAAFSGLEALSGELRAELGVGAVTARGEGLDALVARTSLNLTAPLTGEPTFAPSLTLRVGEARATLEGLDARVSELGLTLGARELPLDFQPPMRVSGRVDLGRAEVSPARGEQLVLARTRLDVAARLGEGFIPSEVELGTRLGSFTQRAAGASLEVDDADVRVNITRLDLDLEDPLASRADLSARLGAGRVESRAEGSRTTITRPGLTLRGRYAGRAASSFSGAIPIGGIRMTAPGEPSRELLPAGELGYAIEALEIDPEAPLRSSARLRLNGRFAPLTLELSANLAEGNGELNGHIAAAPLGGLAALAGDVEGLSLARANVDLRVRGQWRGLDGESPSLEHHVEGHVGPIGLEQPGLSLALPRVTLRVDHRGRGDDHNATLTVTAERPVVNGHALGRALALATEISADGGQRVAHIESALTGPGGFETRARIDGRITADGTVRHTERVTLSGLVGIEQLIPVRIRDEHPLDYESLSLELNGEGSLAGLLTAALEPREGGVAGGTIRQTTSLTLRGIRYEPEGMRILVPDVTGRVTFEQSPERVVADANLDLSLLDFQDVNNHVVLHGVHPHVHLESRGPIEEGRFTLELDGPIDRIEQDYLAAYPMEDVNLAVRFTMDQSESMALERFELVNERGGTRFHMTKTYGRAGGVERADVESRRVLRGTQHLSLRGQLEQDLSRIDGSPETLRATGRLTLPFSVDSGDGALFRVHATARLDDVGLELPESDLEVVGVRASIPVEEAIEWSPETGVTVVANTARNPFARVRFQDIQPFLNENSYLEIERVRYRDIETGPIAGSLQIDRNVFSINGIRAEIAGGVIGGQLLVDYLTGEERVQFRGNVTGLRPDGSDDPFDANCALVFDPNRLELDGRIQIVRVSTAHLNRLLDMLDPFREDTALNSVRGALGFGHPDRVTIGISQGLMSMNVRLGGIIGQLISIGEIQGVALGPFMTRHVAPLMPE